MKLLFTILSIVLLSSCVQKMRDVTIHFEVDMRQETNVTTVGVIGEDTPLSWDTAIPLTDPDSDGIYEGTVVIKAAYNYAAFKFKLNNEIIELEGKKNRLVTIDDNNSGSYSGVFDKDN